MSITHHEDISIKLGLIKGGAAGSHTLASIVAVDSLRSVWMIDIATDGTITTVADLTSEFTAAAGAITNTAGTDTTDMMLQVLWIDQDE